MKTYNDLERAKRDKIRQLSVDEAERYINKLNKEMADAWGSLDNSFNIDVKTMMRNSELCDEAVNILNDKYNMDLLVTSSRLNTLVEKHLSDISDVRDFMLKTFLDAFISTHWQTSHNILILTQFLNILYEFYWITPADIEGIIDMTDAAEEDKSKIILKLDDLPVYDLYRQHFMNSLEINIKHMASIIDEEVSILKRLMKKFQFKEDEEATGRYYDDFRKDMMKYQQLSNELIAMYEELKQDGFHNAKTIEAELLSKCIDEEDMDVDYFNKLHKDIRPSYDVNNFIFIPPKAHVEEMEKDHPDWKRDDPADEDATYDDEGMDEWYAAVTNPVM